MLATIVTREFRLEDYEAAAQLWSEVEGIEIAEGDGRDDIALFLERNGGASRVAVAEGKIVAVALCGHDGRRGHIYHLAVKPTYRRHGLGHLLVKECLGHLRAAGIQRAIILVADGNDCGLSFWQRVGWEVVSGAVVLGIDL